MKIVGVYKIENKITGECYVGSSRNVKKRWRNHRSDLRHNKHKNRKLQAAYDAHGPDVFIFEILEQGELSQLIAREQFFMDLLKPAYNIIPRADRSELAEETRARMRGNKNGQGRLNTGRGYCQWTNKSGITCWKARWRPTHGQKQKSKNFRTEEAAAAFIAELRKSLDASNHSSSQSQSQPSLPALPET